MFTTLLTALLLASPAHAAGTRADCDELDDRAEKAWCMAAFSSTSACSAMIDPYEQMCEAWASKNDRYCEELDEDDAADIEACEMLTVRTRAKSDTSGLSLLKKTGSRGRNLASYVVAVSSLDKGDCSSVSDSMMRKQCLWAVTGLTTARDGIEETTSTSSLASLSKLLTDDDAAADKGETLSTSWTLRRVLGHREATKQFTAYLRKSFAHENYAVWHEGMNARSGTSCHQFATDWDLGNGDGEFNISNHLRDAWETALDTDGTKLTCEDTLEDAGLSRTQLTRMSLSADDTIKDLVGKTTTEAKVNLADVFTRFSSERSWYIWLGRNT